MDKLCGIIEKFLELFTVFKKYLLKAILNYILNYANTYILQQLCLNTNFNSQNNNGTWIVYFFN